MKQYRLTDEREKEFELVGTLEDIKVYLGKEFNECEDYFEVKDLLNEQNDGMAGYQIEEF